MGEASELDELLRLVRKQSEAVESLQEQIRSTRAKYDADREQWEEESRRAQRRSRWVTLILFVALFITLRFWEMQPRPCLFQLTPPAATGGAPGWAP
jgi:t-SNARE complex subunit (syntaxin)